MALFNRVAPSVVLPGILAPQTQSVDFDKYIGSKTNLAGKADEALYITAIENINSETSVGQQWNENLTNQGYSLGQIQVPFYRINAYFEYDENERAKFEALSNGVSLPAFLENLAKQGINQRRHQAILYGFDNSLEQGLLANATLVNVPADSNNKSTLLEYSIPELQIFLSALVRQAMDNSFNLIKPVIFASSVRVINYLKTAIVPVGTYIENGGVASIAQVYDRVVSEWLGCPKVEFVADDLLYSKDGQDSIVIIAPGMQDDGAAQSDDVNQNLVGMFNSITYNTMYDASEGLVRMQNPDNFGKMSALLSYKMTPGVSLRSEAVIEAKIKYSN